MRKAFLLWILVLIMVPALMAQQRGSSGGRSTGRATQSGTRDQIRSTDRLHDQTRDQDRTRDQDKLQDRDRLHDQDRLRLHATSAQKQQYNVAKSTTTQSRNMAKEMRKNAQGNGFNSAKARQQHLQLQQQVQTMQQEHARLMQGMTGEQASAVRTRTEEMNRIQERLNTRLQSMQNELQNQNPDRKRVAEHARAMENDMVRWQEQHRNMASTLGLQD